MRPLFGIVPGQRRVLRLREAFQFAEERIVPATPEDFDVPRLNLGGNRTSAFFLRFCRPSDGDRESCQVLDEVSDIAFTRLTRVLLQDDLRIGFA